MNILNPFALFKMNEEQILNDIKLSASLLDGEYLHQEIIDSGGRVCKRVIITYDDKKIPSRF
tara:strand:- start:94 stop:279 length:186 start_codon:yes stop_codon:yes gene_type:complete